MEATSSVPRARPLVDRFARAHATLRISVTDRCQMRCAYCLPLGAPPSRGREEILSFEEIERAAAAGAALGLRRIRLTGGEPLLRRGLDGLVRRLRAVAGIEEVALTTNGLLLDRAVDSLVEAGLGALHVSLDSVDPRTFRRSTGTGASGVRAILSAIRRCRAEYPSLRLRLNAVVVRGLNDGDVERLAGLGRDLGVEIQFVEFMPFFGVAWRPDLVVPGDEIVRRIAAAHSVRSVPRRRAAGAARRFAYRDGGGAFGLVEAVSRPACAACDRLRLRADGSLLPCLFDRAGVDLRAPLRDGAPDDALAEAFRAAVAAKGPGGALAIARGAPARPPRMAEVGG